MKIIDNFLDQEDFNKIHTLMMGQELSWYYLDGKDTEKGILFEHNDSDSEEENRNLVTVVNSPYEAIEDAHATAILTEWDEFKKLDWDKVFESMLKPAFLFDGRRLLERNEMEEKGFKFYSIGN